MSKIPTLADLHAEQCLTAGLLLDEGHWRKELQAEVERMEAAHQQELAQVKADLKSCQAKNRELMDGIDEAEETMFRIEPKIDALITERDSLLAERDAWMKDCEHNQAEIAELREALQAIIVSADKNQAAINMPLLNKARAALEEKQ